MQDGSNLPEGKPQVSSILHLNADQSGGATGPNIPILRKYATVLPHASHDHNGKTSWALFAFHFTRKTNSATQAKRSLST